MRDELVPLADVLTPNLPEAEMLLQRRIEPARALAAAARELRALGARAVLLKGGHRGGARVSDYLLDTQGAAKFSHRRLPIEAHGTGCTLAAAIAAGLALGWPRRRAIARAERYLQARLRNSIVGGNSRVRLLA